MGLRALSDKHLLFKFYTKLSARERKQSALSKGTPSSAEKVVLLLDKGLGLLLSPTPNTHMQDLTALITHTVFKVWSQQDVYFVTNAMT